MTIVKSTKKRNKRQYSIVAVSCYAMAVIILVIGGLYLVLRGEDSVQSLEGHPKTAKILLHSNKQNFKPSAYHSKLGIEGILSGDLHLISIDGWHIGGKSSSKPYSIQANFCQLDWSLHKSNPSSVPMNKDLIRKSPHCKKTEVSMDLFDIVSKAREYDKSYPGNIHTMTPKGFVFHESRCGSTLVANSLAGFDPEKNRVYSESAPPITAAKMYESSNEENSLQVLRDVIYMMGKFEESKPHHIFY